MPTYYRRDEWVTDALGNAISGADVYVCSQPANTGTIPPSPEVQLYADPAGVTPITQPVLTDGYGHAFYYVAPGTYTVVYYSPQITEVVLPDQTIAAGNVSFPITVVEGGTGATTAEQALINLGAAASGANADITSLAAIPNTSISTSGYVYNDGTDPKTSIGALGLTYGAGVFGSTGNVIEITTQAWPGFGVTNIGVGVSDGGQATLIAPGFVSSSNQIIGEAVEGITSGAFGTIVVGNLSNAAIVSASANQPLLLRCTASTSTLNSVIIDSGAGASPIPHVGLFGLNTYPTQTTVGAAGGASALPATPTLFVPITINGTEYVFALYAKS